MPKVGGEESPLRKCLREKSLQSGPITTPHSAHKPRRASRSPGQRKASILRRCLREERLDNHPLTIPDYDHKRRKATRPSGQAVRPAHRSRAATLAFITIALMAAVVGSLTWAYFSDTAATTATFSTGTVGLEICDGQACSSSLDLPAMANIYPGWSYTTSGLQLHNAGTLTMTVIISATETSQSGLAEVIGVQIYRAPSPEGTPIFSDTFETLNTADPLSYGPLAAEAYDDITFLFDWPETEEDQTGFAGASLTEEVTFYGTTEGAEQD